MSTFFSVHKLRFKICGTTNAHKRCWVIRLCDGKNREKGWTGMVHLLWGCEGIPDPSEVSSLGKLSVFLISYNLITLNDINTDLEMLISHKKVLTDGGISAKIWHS